MSDAVDQLTSTDEATDVKIYPDAAMATTYAALRGSLPRLVAGPDAVASLFAGTSPSRPSTDVPN